MAGSVVVLNPGTGRCRDTYERLARQNVRALLRDAKMRARLVRRIFRNQPDGRRDDGRYGYDLIPLKGRRHHVRMPGLPLARVRFTGATEQSAWDFPRLYLDGCSWLWKYAVELLAEEA